MSKVNFKNIAISSTYMSYLIKFIEIGSKMVVARGGGSGGWGVNGMYSFSFARGRILEIECPKM